MKTLKKTMRIRYSLARFSEQVHKWAGGFSDMHNCLDTSGDGIAQDVAQPTLAERLAEAEIAGGVGDVKLLTSVLPDLIADLGNEAGKVVPIASALVTRAAFADADAILEQIIISQPDCYAAFETYAMSAHHKRDWVETTNRWRAAYEAFQDDSRPATHFASALLMNDRLDEAEVVLSSASDRFPENAEIARAFASLPMARGNVEDALVRLATFCDRFPDNAEGFALSAEALRSLGRFEQAEAMLEAVRSKFESNFQFNFQSAWNATRLGRWEDSFRRWDTLLRRYPGVQGVDMAVGDAITLWHLAAAEGDQQAIAAELPAEIARRAGAMSVEAREAAAPGISQRDLMMRFESLGDRCEFGLVQRHFGAEPISLLRWSGIEPKELIAALEGGFDGVGDPANTFVNVNSQSKEYFAGDQRYFYMHTFIKENEASEDILFQKFCHRLTYLKRKLLDDLREGEKVFVYKTHVGQLTDAEAKAISDVLGRHYPASRVMLMRAAPDASQVGAIAPLAKNAIWGFISRFSENLESRFIRFDEWLAVCTAAAYHFGILAVDQILGDDAVLSNTGPEAALAQSSEAKAPEPDHARRAMQDAAAALDNNDLTGAQEAWKRARTFENAPIEAWLHASEHPGDHANDEEALALLQDAASRFPTHPRPFHDLARAMERRKDWPAAESYWRGFIEADRSKWWAYTALAASLRAQGEHIGADSVLAEGAVRLPFEPQLPAETARATAARGNPQEAIRVWELVIERFPDRWIGFRGKAQALAQSGQSKEADDLVETCAPTLPADLDALHDLARLAERRRDWKGAEAVWWSFLALEQRPVWAHLALARTLREQSRYPEAEDVLRDACQRFPNDVDLEAEAAQCAELRGDQAEALRHWKAVGALRPRSPAGPLGEAGVLRRNGSSEAADQVISEAVKRLPDEPSLLESYALNAMARNAWVEALGRLEAAQSRFPSSDALRQRIFEVRLKIADEGAGAPPVAPEDESVARNRALVMQFESLGGGGHGCEFGIFQRHFGAEPLGLLRWADIYQDQLTKLLETEFAGVGDPEFTNIFVPGDGSNLEYWTTDTRYHMAMRSFVLSADVPLDRMRQQVTKRFRYLSRKLGDDLRSAAKIFVYKNMKRNLTEAEVQRLHAACRRYGDNMLLYIRYEDSDHPCGTVVAQDAGLLIGYIDHFSHTPDTDEFIGVATDALLEICRNAHRLCERDLQSHPAAA